MRRLPLGLIVFVALLMIGTSFIPHGAAVSALGHAPSAAPTARALPAAVERAPAAAPHPTVGRVTTTTETALPNTATNSYTTLDPASETVYSVSTGVNWNHASSGDVLTAFNMTTGAATKAPIQLADPATAIAVGMAYAPVQNELFVLMDNYGFGNYSNGYVLIVSATSWSVVANISDFTPLSSFTPYYLTYDAVSGDMWVEDSYSLIIVQISPATNAWTYYFTASCGGCYAYGLIDVPSNETLWVPTGTNSMGAINTSTDSWESGWTWLANPNWYSDIGVEDTDFNLVAVTNASATGDVNYFYPNGTFAFQATGLGPGYATAVAYDPYYDLVFIADWNTTPGGGDEIWEYFTLYGVLYDHYQNANVTYYGGDYFDSLSVADVAGSPDVVTGGEGNGSWLLQVNATSHLQPVFQYPSDSTTWTTQVWTDTAHGRYYVYAQQQAAITAYNLTTGAVEWQFNLAYTGYYPGFFYWAIDTSQELIYISDLANIVYVYDATSGAFLTDIVLPGTVGYLADDPVHHLLYAADYSDADTQVVNTTGGVDSIGTPLVSPGVVCSLAAIPATGEAATESCSYPTNSTVTVFDGATAAVLTNFSIYGNSIQGAMAADDAGNLYVPITQAQTVIVYDTATEHFVANWSTGLLSPMGVAADAADGVVLVTGYYNNTDIELMNLSTGAVTQTVGLSSPAYSIPAFANTTATFYTPMWYTGQLALTAIVPLPSVPTGLGRTAGNTTVALHWSASTGSSGYPVTGYDVLWATSASGPWTPGPSSTTTSATVSGLTDGTTYYFVVESVSAAGTSGPSANVNAIPIGAPYPPQSLALSVDGANQINVSWAAPAHTDGAAVTNYTLEWSTSAAGPWTSVSIGTGTTHALTGLTASTTYYVKIVAWNSVGASSPSTTASGTTAAGHGNGGGGNNANGSSSPGGLSTLDWIVLVVVLVVVIAAIAGVLMMRRRGRGPAGAPTPPPQWNPPPAGAPSPPPPPPAGPSNLPPGPPPGAQ